MRKDSRIYIAGHHGMVGSAIVRKLRSQGFENLIMRSSHDLDLTRQAATEAFFGQEGPEYVFLAAARVGGIMANNTYRAQFIYDNLMIQNNIIHAAMVNGVKKLLFLGSSCIYPKLAPQPIREEYLLTGLLESTNEPYAIAKIAGIKLCESYNRQYGCRFVSVMPSNLYGPNDNFNLETSHVLPAMIRKMFLAECLGKNDWDALRADLDKRPVDNATGQSSEEEIMATLSNHGITYAGSPTFRQPDTLASQRPHPTLSLWGSGTPMREFLHVDDLVDAVVFIMQNDLRHDLYNVGSGTDLSISELAGMIKKITGFQGSLSWEPSKPDGTPRKLLDVSRLRAENWTHQIALEAGIRQTYGWYLSHQA